MMTRAFRLAAPLAFVLPVSGAVLLAGCNPDEPAPVTSTPVATASPAPASVATGPAAPGPMARPSGSPKTAMAPTTPSTPTTSRVAGIASQTPTPMAQHAASRGNEREAGTAPVGTAIPVSPTPSATPLATAPPATPTAAVSPQAATPTEEAVATPATTAAPTPPAAEKASEAATPAVGAGGSAPASRRSDAAGASFLTSAEGDDVGRVGATSDLDPDDGPVYTWHDGDRILTARLQTSLVAERQSGVSGARSEIVRRDEKRADTVADPVFRSESGALMTLPGGILLLLDPEWDQARVDQFFADNGIAKGRVGERAFGEHAFFVEADPGFPSLSLANALAGQAGVLISSPNWRREAELY